MQLTTNNKLTPFLSVTIIKRLFRDERQFHLFSILTLTTLFGIALIIIRLYLIDFDFSILHNLQQFKKYRGTHATFLFLIWNLFLAWVPYWIALSLDFFNRNIPPTEGGGSRRFSQKSNLIILILMSLWILFFPNAPYILTDLLHLHRREMVPHWFDVMLFITFAWAGLMLGYASLFEVQRFLEVHFSKKVAWGIISFAIFLGGFGVFMGRFQRWNSWDIVKHPFKIVRQQIYVLTHPLQHLETLGLVAVLSGFMFLGYLTINALRTQD